MKLLPHWVITNDNPAFYDTDSGTAIEQTAKVYKAMNELIVEYNNFVDSTNAKIEEFNSGVISDNEAFRIALRQEFQDFINVVELKVEALDQYAKNELNTRIQEYYEELKSSDEIQDIILNEFKAFKTDVQNTIKELTPVIFELDFNNETLALSFKNGQNAEQLFSLLNNDNPVIVRYASPVGYVVLNMVQKITVPTYGSAYVFQAINGLELISYTFTSSGFSLSLNMTIADYVEEEGNSGLWAFRKWASGKCECWCTVEYTSIEATASGGSVTLTVDLPFEFSANAVAYVHPSMGAYKIRKAYQLTGSKTQIQIYFKLDETASLAINDKTSFNVEIKGTWK